MIGLETSISPSAEIDSTATIADGVEVGPHCYVGPQVTIGAGTRLHRGAMVMSHTTIGERNEVFPYAVLGGEPQDRKDDPNDPGVLVIGDGNIIREHMTIHRSVGSARPTVVGDNCFLMASSHIAHNAQVGNGVTLVNNAGVGAHTTVGDGVNMSSCTMVHQFVQIGELVMFQGLSGVSQHVPPFMIVSRRNQVAGINVIGMRRSGSFSNAEIRHTRELFRFLYRTSGTFGEALRQAHDREWGKAGARVLEFIDKALSQEPPHKRGICGGPTD